MCVWVRDKDGEVRIYVRDIGYNESAGSSGCWHILFDKNGNNCDKKTKRQLTYKNICQKAKEKISGGLQ